MPRLILTALLAALGGLCGGLLWGFWLGVQNTGSLAALPTIVLDTRLAGHIEAGRTSLYRSHLDTMINSGIKSYIWYEESGNHLLSSLFLEEFVDHKEDYIDELVQFRLAHPTDERLAKMGENVERQILPRETLDYFLAEDREIAAFIRDRTGNSAP